MLIIVHLWWWTCHFSKTWCASGAGLIVLGTVASALREDMLDVVLVDNGDTSSGGIDPYWYSVLLFAGGQVLQSQHDHYARPIQLPPLRTQANHVWLRRSFWQ